MNLLDVFATFARGFSASIPMNETEQTSRQAVMAIAISIEECLLFRDRFASRIEGRVLSSA